MVDVSKVQERADKVMSGALVIGKTIGNITIANPTDIDNMALRLSRGGPMVPPHCRNDAGVCHALIVQALEWLMPIMAVLNKSYVVNNRGVERIAYESQLIHAVIERNAPLKSRLRFEIIGEGDERRCKVWGTFKGEDEPHEYLSEKLAKLRDARGRNDKGDLKGSPLWDHQPEVQLFYSASRQWARLFAPDVILGAYTPEDPVYEMRDVTPPEPGMLKRLREAKAHGDRGFDLAHVQRETGHTVIEGEATPGPVHEEAKNVVEHEPDGRSSDDQGRGAGPDPQVGGAAAGGDPDAVGGTAAGEGTARAGQVPDAGDAAEARSGNKGGKASRRR